MIKTKLSHNSSNKWAFQPIKCVFLVFRSSTIQMTMKITCRQVDSIWTLMLTILFWTFYTWKFHSIVDAPVDHVQNFRNVLMVQISILQEVSRLILGLNCGRELEPISLPEPAKALSSKHDFDLQVGIYPNCCYNSLVLESLLRTNIIDTMTSWYIHGMHVGVCRFPQLEHWSCLWPNWHV